MNEDSKTDRDSTLEGEEEEAFLRELMQLEADIEAEADTFKNFRALSRRKICGLFDEDP